MRKILSKKVTRKQFLFWLFTLVISFMGINNFLETLNTNPKVKKINNDKAQTFGNGVYGGVKKG